MGAIGGFYGAKLAHAGKEVHFLSHSDYQYVKERGLQVDSCDGSFHLPQINAYGAASDMPKCDVVLIGLKTVNNHLLPELLPPLLKEDTLVVLIQNGIGVEEDVQKIFPEVQLAAGLAFICSAKTEPGRVNHQCYGYINIGNYSCKQQEKIDEVVDDFRKAGVDANEVEYLEARWKKAVWNMPFNGMTVALNTQTDILLQHPSTLQLIKDQMMEVIEAAQAMGLSPWEVIFKVYLRESIAPIVRAITLTTISLIGLTAMAGAVGAGGLGDFAIKYGHNRFQEDVTVGTVIVLVAIVCLIQFLGNKLAAKNTH